MLLRQKEAREIAHDMKSSRPALASPFPLRNAHPIKSLVRHTLHCNQTSMESPVPEKLVPSNGSPQTHCGLDSADDSMMMGLVTVTIVMVVVVAVIAMVMVVVTEVVMQVVLLLMVVWNQ